MTKITLTFDQTLAQNFAAHRLTWFYGARRSLPFRETKNPYSIWISEIMAQQTQIDTLLPYYHRFIEAFPTVNALAEAHEDTVLKLWEGLGYYSRAKNLHKAAKIICTDYNGHFPDHYEGLIKLPGIGPYTAGAISSIAYKEKVPAIDGNVLRVISRFNNSFGDIADTTVKKAITQWVTKALPDEPGDFNEALMELGALICTPKSPKCMLCPVASDCAAHACGTASELPVKSKKVKQKKLQMEVAIIDNGGSLYLVKRPEKGLLAGLWSFPIVEAGAVPGDALATSLSAVFPNLPAPRVLGTDKHVFSHIIWDMRVYYFKLENGAVHEEQALYGESVGTFKNKEALNAVALPVAFSKLMVLLK
ncbi:MAG: A/G-specific adenine glycosylase [Eubacterium sp.]